MALVSDRGEIIYFVVVDGIGVLESWGILILECDGL